MNDSKNNKSNDNLSEIDKYQRNFSLLNNMPKAKSNVEFSKRPGYYQELANKNFDDWIWKTFSFWGA